jgi:UDP-3-O-[3-hydroxymyristoyl] N-acetylglucosamine deacetylase
MIKQQTLGNPVSCSGIGLHSGRNVRMSVLPALANSGIVFKRLDVPAAQALVAARYDLVSDTRLGTTITNRHGVCVSTIEHLMAALWGAGIDNATVELNGPEVPIMDGSSEPFMFMLECARIIRQNAPRRLLRVLKSVEIKDGESIARVAPNEEGDDGCVIDIEIDYRDTIIHRQRAVYDFREITFKQSLSRARTFGFEHEVAALRSQGLALGGSLENAIVVGKEKILNDDGLRYGDEFLRHKALDCLGDLFLAGTRIDARFTFIRPGHPINNKLLRALLADESAYALGNPTPLVAPADPALSAYA